MTIFRLSLNVSATRLILLDGYGGSLISAFGSFVVGQNMVVGFVIFLIIVIIQFLVITRGAERVAEVAARFTLDAMPGKQMSIDADMNAGLINESQARARRRDVEREADFYGAMDGASKFVKGDAIASIIVTVVNVMGGLLIGIMNGQAVMDALNQYALLTIGNGLVTQVPAILMATATGIIVTRSASDNNLGADFVSQLTAQPKSLMIAAGTILALGLVPGMPHLVFITVAAGFGYLGYLLRNSAQPEPEVGEGAAQAAATREADTPAAVAELLPVDPVEVELGLDLVTLVDSSQGAELADRIGMIRRQLALELGFILPIVRLRDNVELKGNSYCLKIRGVAVARGELMLGMFLAMDPTGGLPRIQGVSTKEPAFGLTATWVSGTDKEQAEMMGYTVVDPVTVLSTHLTEVMKRHAHELLTRQTLQDLLDSLRERASAAVNEVIPNLMTLGQVQRVLGNLLYEGVSIRDLELIMETLGDCAPVTKDVDVLTEYVRQALAGPITAQLLRGGESLQVITLSASLESRLSQSLTQTDSGSYLNVDPETLQVIVSRLGTVIQRAAQNGVEPVVLTAPVVRFYFRRLIERAFPRITVLSYNEINPEVQVQSIGVVTAD
jgi:flagellar biosynthesis protein FlhA